MTYPIYIQEFIKAAQNAPVSWKDAVENYYTFLRRTHYSDTSVHWAIYAEGFLNGSVDGYKRGMSGSGQ